MPFRCEQLRYSVSCKPTSRLMSYQGPFLDSLDSSSFYLDLEFPQMNETCSVASQSPYCSVPNTQQPQEHKSSKPPPECLANVSFFDFVGFSTDTNCYDGHYIISFATIPQDLFFLSDYLFNSQLTSIYVLKLLPSTKNGRI